MHACILSIYIVNNINFYQFSLVFRHTIYCRIAVCRRQLSVLNTDCIPAYPHFSVQLPKVRLMIITYRPHFHHIRTPRLVDVLIIPAYLNWGGVDVGEAEKNLPVPTGDFNACKSTVEVQYFQVAFCFVPILNSYIKLIYNDNHWILKSSIRFKILRCIINIQ